MSATILTILTKHLLIYFLKNLFNNSHIKNNYNDLSVHLYRILMKHCEVQQPNTEALSILVIRVYGASKQ